MKLTNIILKISIILFFLCNLISHSHAFENKILFKVNNEIITSIDLLNEIEYASMLNKNLSALPKDRLFEIAKKSLIKEKIRQIETEKFYSNQDFENEYSELLIKEFMNKANIKSENEFEKFTKQKNIDSKIIIQKMKTEILWNQLIVNKFSNKVKIDHDEIKKNITKNNIQKEYYLLEIVFDLKNEKLEDKYKVIENEITKNGFENAASIHSISQSSKEGGRIGWIKLNSLNKKIKKEILITKKNNYTKPIQIPSGFLILKIGDERLVKIKKDVDAEIDNISKMMINKQLNQYSNIYFNKIKKDFLINEY